MVAATSKPLLALSAGDLMSQQVLMIPEEMSIEGAARLLSRAQVTGAPVVDTAGRCIGVVSATDFIRWVERGKQGARPAEECMCAAWQILEEQKFPADNVRTIMTCDPVTAGPGTRIGALAQMMLDAHIHRVIVVDKNGRPVGVVSSTDVLAAVAQADHFES
jgi:CBS domain-containing protein